MAASTPSTPINPKVEALATPTTVTTPSPLRSKDVLLPLARVKTIMKSSPDVENIGQESLFLITKATELFIMYLTKLSQRHGDDKEVDFKDYLLLFLFYCAFFLLLLNTQYLVQVTYKDLAAIVQRKDSMEFLHDIVPRKIK